MYMRILFILTAAVAFVLSACTTDLEIPFPQHEPKLTLNTFLTEGQPVDLYLTRSFGTLENVTVDKILIRDAQVQLFRNGDLIDNMAFADTLLTDTLFSYVVSQGPGLPDTTIYLISENRTAKYLPSKAIDLPKAGDTYRFVVTHPTYGTASAETTIPAKPDVRNASITRDSIISREFVDSYQQKWTALKVRLNDPAGEENYYSFETAVGYTYTDPNFPVVDTFTTWYWAYTKFDSDPGGGLYGSWGPLADTEINGTIGTLYSWLALPGCCGNPQDADTYHVTSLSVRVISMTEAYARFQEKLELQRINRLDGIESAFIPTEPVVIPSNVEGGYGVVGAFNVTRVEVSF